MDPCGGAGALLKAAAGAIEHASVQAMAHGLELVLRLSSDDGSADVHAGAEGVWCGPASAGCVPTVTIAAGSAAWAQALMVVPPPLYQSFSAWQLRNPAFAVTGDGLAIAQARSFIECLVERWHLPAGVPALPQAAPSLEAITGRYHRVQGPRGQGADLFVERAGEGAPLLCLHTAGADARQYHALMASPVLTRDWQVIAFDLPAHGRSMPAHDWQGEAWRLDQAAYLGWCVAVIEQVVRQPVTLLGCSMGAAMALVLAAERPDLVQGVVALEAPVRPRGRRNRYLTHAQVNGGWHTSAYVRGLMSPFSPLESRRAAAWIYAQGAPGVYDGDLAFYSDEFDGEAVAKAIDGSRTPVVLMTGHYDFSATVADAQALAGWITPSRLVEMPELGHFPMTEHPETLLAYLLPELARLRERAGALPRLHEEPPHG
jgi:pimeloyl-ACP methyl ester carboxylesterase